MARRTLLTAEQLTAALTELTSWSGDTTGIERTFTRMSFLQAAAEVDELAALAEELDHHPDVDIRWRTLRIFLTTHSAGGVTDLDIEFARRVDESHRPLHEVDPELAARTEQLFAEARARKAGQSESS